LRDDLKQKVIANIVKECYWDSNMSSPDIEKILESDNRREMLKVFTKIIYNSKDKLLSLKLFSNKILEEFFKDFKVTYNEKYITKHILILKALLLNEKSHIKSLEWKK